MPMVTGARLGPYEILAPLGAGGLDEANGRQFLVLELVDGERFHACSTAGG
jgi:hypothetical protein